MIKAPIADRSITLEQLSPDLQNRFKGKSGNAVFIEGDNTTTVVSNSYAVTYGEDLNENTPICLLNGKAYKASKSDKSKFAIGICVKNCGADNIGAYITSGIINSGLTLISDKPVFLGIDGTFTQTPETLSNEILQKLGIAGENGIIFADIQAPLTNFE